MKRTVFLIDMQSFYAAVEKVYDARLTDLPVVVAGDPERRSGVILAACPIAKTYGVQTAEALWEAEGKCPPLQIVRPRMQLYVDISTQINELFLTYTDQVEPFSVDESFIELTGTPHETDPEETAKKLQEEIYRQFGIVARIGIGETKILAKSACDLLAKKRPGGIFTLHKDRLEHDFWPFPIKKLFGIGRKMEKHMHSAGIRTIGGLANTPLKRLQKRWGINGELLWQYANGIDPSPVTPNTHQEKKSVGHGMTLPKDYTKQADILVVVRELAEEVARRTRSERLLGRQISLGVRGTYDTPDGFSRQIALHMPTNDGRVIYRAARTLFERHWNGTPVRSLSLALDKVEPDAFRQLNLFDELEDQPALNRTLDTLKERYGADAIMYASSLTDAGQALERAKKIGGHYK
ncbi:DNA polymerase IV [Salisediminibacterium halotolerans]|uniref:DNA polymerase IV n=1 Tax=Salisediminibacterium halotolerans TaxID=517425 RepID=UPI000EB568E0|nr:DNA polymerase IV [Salisediminibacterium halotolerans]RLJ72313.1 DNA polymerase-4/DNA polymerase V [Actinophytocola xinjiangensis]RPE85527.1 DNA polymerase-4/DNA polymerase V [Salisediminibacterium halotolerans]TWG33482.1 DNA polymerase-4/DNA polymerase V [Salisediminibacterium halotolerans]GEL07933.1 DNA polymerase IV 2 [Salisediminibacterium halotolerans]